MKILVTGFTGVQCRASTGQLDLISNIASIVGGLEDMGHEVEWRPVTPGEDLTPYDRCVVSINGVASWVSPFALGGLYVMGARRDTVLTMDDWQAPFAFASGNPEKELAVVWNEKLGRQNHFEALENPVAKNAIDAAVEELCYIHYRKLLIPTFAEGDLSLLNLGAPNAMKYDPSSYMIDRYEYNPTAEKARLWVSAGLADKASWFARNRFEWAVEFYGIRKLGHTRVREAELAGIYSERWGVLSPPHKHVGSGWFRVRFLMAALAGAVVYCDDREGASIHPCDAYRMPLHIIEGYDDEKLRSLAEWQKDAFFSTLWSKEKLKETLHNFIITEGSPAHGTRLFETEGSAQ